MLISLATAWAADFNPPLTEIEHPSYVDADGVVVAWPEIRAATAGTGALGQVRRRRIGRDVMRILFAAATAAEVWGTYELGRNQNWAAVPLGAQASATGLCEVLLWTGIPQYRIEDRAIVLAAANSRPPTSSGTSRQP